MPYATQTLAPKTSGLKTPGPKTPDYVAKRVATTAAGTLLGLAVAFAAPLESAQAEDATGNDTTGTAQVAALAPDGGTPESRAADLTGGFDMRVPESAGMTKANTHQNAFQQGTGIATTKLDDNTRLKGIHRFEIDLYNDDMRPDRGQGLR